MGLLGLQRRGGWQQLIGSFTPVPARFNAVFRSGLLFIESIQRTNGRRGEKGDRPAASMAASWPKRSAQHSRARRGRKLTSVIYWFVKRV